MNEKFLLYGKFVAGAVGAAATACLGLIPDGSTTWTIATIVAATATALAVYFAPYIKPST